MSSRPGDKRLPGLGWLPNPARVMFVSMLGEFVGTFLFLFFAFAGTQVANTPPGRAGAPPNMAALLYIALSFAFSLLVNVWVFFRISGGLFNPAVTVAMGLVGAIGWLKVVLLFITQVVAGIAAAGMVSALFPGHLNVRTTLGHGTSAARGVWIEAFLTAELIFTIFLLAAEKHRATFLAPVGIGMALFIAELAGVFFTGGSLNPARSFGPDVVLRKFDHHHWIYWVGPLLGALMAVVFYRFIKALEYETANPGADNDGRERLPDRSGSRSDEPIANQGAHPAHTDGTNESSATQDPYPSRMPALQSPPSSRYTNSSASHFGPPRLPAHVYLHTGDAQYSREDVGSYRSRHGRGKGAASFRHGPDAESGNAGLGSRNASAAGSPSASSQSSD